MKRTVGTSIIAITGILLIIGGILFWQNKKVEAPALREGDEERVTIKEENFPETEWSDQISPEDEKVESSPVTVPSTPGVTSQAKANVSTADCENECQNYTEAEALHYCRSLCGLEVPTYQDKDCANVAVNEKDFCYKEEAVRKQDTEMCAKIKDVKLRKTCEARIAEDLF